MPQPPTLFFDLGGVLLTNAWDTPTRTRAAEAFGLDNVDFQTRHGMLKTAFETGRRSLESYILKTVFYKSRTFSPEDFKGFMFAQSKSLGESLEWTRKLAATRKYRMFTLNNESRELHEYRVKAFRLGEIFDAFFTSCYLGQAKPDEEIYLQALGMANCPRGQAVFIDDRPLNTEAAQTLGLKAILYRNLDQLRSDLKEHGIEA